MFPSTEMIKSSAFTGQLEIRKNRFKPRPLPDFTATLLNPSHIAEFAARYTLGFFPSHAAAHQIGDLLVEVFADDSESSL